MSSIQLPSNLSKPLREQQSHATVRLDLDAPGNDYARFWESTGFSAAVLTTRSDMLQTLQLTGHIAHHGFRYIRPHYLLNLLVVPSIDAEEFDIDFSRLDAALDAYLANGLRPVFELMGYPARSADAEEDYGERFQAMNRIPETCFDNLDDDGQIAAWYRLVQQLAEHLVARYGAEEVRQWWFETWNEPNIGFWKWSFQAFLNYWDACSEALRAVDPQIRFGGPGNHVAWSDHLFDVLEHCLQGRNHITGETGSRIDFIAIHCKGPSDHVKFGDKQELAVRAEIVRRFPALADRPFFNDECDPVTGWQRDLWWHANTYYPAWVARSVASGMHPDFSVGDLPYTIMSSDNTFMGTWGQRVLHHRFHNDDYSRVSLVKKPVSVGMSLIGKLRGPAIHPAMPTSIQDRIAVVATRADDQVAILVSNLMKFEAEEFHNNTISPTLSQVERMQHAASKIHLQVDAVPADMDLLVHYRLEDQAGPNPLRRWQELGEPATPTAAQLNALRRHGELSLVDEPLPLGTEQSLGIDLQLPSPALSLIVLLRDPARAPSAPQNLACQRYPGIHGGSEDLLTWHCADVEAAALRRWEIEIQVDDSHTWQRLDTADLIDTAWCHAAEANEEPHRYRVCARDLWGRIGPWTEVSVA